MTKYHPLAMELQSATPKITIKTIGKYRATESGPSLLLPADTLQPSILICQDVFILLQSVFFVPLVFNSVSTIFINFLLTEI